MLCSGGYAMVGASNVFNQVFEKDLDKLMANDKTDLSSENVSSPIRIFYRCVLRLLELCTLYDQYQNGFFCKYFHFLYACLYTPLKQKHSFSVFVGAFPGAIPFMLGWVAATNEFGIEPGVLFMIQFFWQFPHFWAIGWVMHDQYEKQALKCYPLGSRIKSTAFQIVFLYFLDRSNFINSRFSIYRKATIVNSSSSLGRCFRNVFFCFIPIRFMYLQNG